MTTTTTFFATRTLARNAAAELNGKVKDHGTDAPAGKRWGVVVEVTTKAEIIAAAGKEINAPVIDVPATKSRNILVLGTPGIGKTAHMSNVLSGGQVLKNRYGKKVQVQHKRSTAVAKAEWLKDYNAM